MEKFEWYMPEMPKPVEPSADFIREIQNRLTYALVALVKPGIKGEVTKGKLRWRGIQRKTVFRYEDWAYEMYICDDGSFKYLAIGVPVGKYEPIVWPVISQRKTQISLDFEKDDMLFMEYSFWKEKNNVVVFGATSRKNGEYKCSGIMDQITKSE